MEKETCALLSISLSELGDPFAIAAFCSNSREEVRYQKIKTFDEPYSALVKSKLAGIESSYSTRLGAAIRHSGQELSSQTTYRRLLLILTDGEPSDIDVTDEKYLAEDARHAVTYLAQNGIDTFCFGLETENQTYLTKIFGRKNSLQIRDIEELPERVLSMYLQLAT
jgi:nitric oxide reductase NorD protein